MCERLLFSRSATSRKSHHAKHCITDIFHIYFSLLKAIALNFLFPTEIASQTVCNDSLSELKKRYLSIRYLYRLAGIFLETSNALSDA
jgi:hypothetical protein